jgi:hypothetical protein
VDRDERGKGRQKWRLVGKARRAAGCSNFPATSMPRKSKAAEIGRACQSCRMLAGHEKRKRLGFSVSGKWVSG